MPTRLKKINIIGLKKDEFDKLINSPEGINLRPAKLIPFINPGKEEALASVFLSALKLIKEFREDILESMGIKIGKTGKIFVYTEINFPNDKDNRIDGLIVIVKGGTIKDAALLEFKNGKSEIDEEQIKRYLEVAKENGVPKFVTISNQFVSAPTQYPIQIKPSKNIELFHLSWSYILTLAQILLFKNDKNIEDEDQVAIMNEVVDYFEHEKSGVCGFTQMKPGWKSVVDKNKAGIELKYEDADVKETVESWMQEERDMALILSRSLGVLVKSGENKYKNNFAARLERDIKKIVNNKVLTSTLRVERAVSDILIKVSFDRRCVEMSVSLDVPRNKKSIGQMGWLKKQLERCQNKNPRKHPLISSELHIGVRIKNINNFGRFHSDRLEEKALEYKNKEIREFKVVQVKDFGGKFSAQKKFVKIIEEMLLDFYEVIVQYLEQPKVIAPKISPIHNNENDDFDDEAPVQEVNLNNNNNNNNSESIEVESENKSEKKFGSINWDDKLSEF